MLLKHTSRTALLWPAQTHKTWSRLSFTYSTYTSQPYKWLTDSEAPSISVCFSLMRSCQTDKPQQTWFNRNTYRWTSAHIFSHYKPPTTAREDTSQLHKHTNNTHNTITQQKTNSPSLLTLVCVCLTLILQSIEEESSRWPDTGNKRMALTPYRQKPDTLMTHDSIIYTDVCVCVLVHPPWSRNTHCEY